MKNVSYNPKLGQLPLDVFKAYVKKHHKEDEANAEKIHKELASKKVK